MSDFYDAYIKLPEVVYLKRYDKDLKKGNQTIERIEVTDRGIIQLIKDASYEYKGYPDPRAVRAVGAVKKMILCGVRVLSSAPYILPFFFLARKHIIREFLKYSDRVLRDYYYQPRFYLESGREIFYAIADNTLVKKYLEESLSPKEQIRFNLAMLLTCLWEYDNAYRFRIQFILENLKDINRLELRRLCDILIEREPEEVMKSKWRAVKRIVPFLPMKEIREFLSKIDISKVRMDAGDLYWAAKVSNFNYN